MSDETGLVDAGEEDGAGGLEEGASECQALGTTNVVEEEVELNLLGSEETVKGGLVDVFE